MLKSMMLVCYAAGALGVFVAIVLLYRGDEESTFVSLVSAGSGITFLFMGAVLVGLDDIREAVLKMAGASGEGMPEDIAGDQI